MLFILLQTCKTWKLHSFHVELFRLHFYCVCTPAVLNTVKYAALKQCSFKLSYISSYVRNIGQRAECPKWFYAQCKYRPVKYYEDKYVAKKKKNNKTGGFNSTAWETAANDCLVWQGLSTDNIKV